MKSSAWSPGNAAPHPPPHEVKLELVIRPRNITPPTFSEIPRWVPPLGISGLPRRTQGWSDAEPGCDVGVVGMPRSPELHIPLNRRLPPRCVFPILLHSGHVRTSKETHCEIPSHRERVKYFKLFPGMQCAVFSSKTETERQRLT